jgi:dCMP deaminase
MCNKDVRLFTKVLEALEERSTCARIQVACAAVRDGRIISTGWNGVESGKQHCKDHFANHTHEQMLAEHRQFSIDNELHAEENCILFAEKNGISLEGADVYVTYNPCPDCAQLIIDAGVRNVYFKLLYDRAPSTGPNMLKEKGIGVYQVTTETIIQQ